jgi:hypothetical protein
MIRKLQLEVPRITKAEEYSFPYWTVGDRVVGQPINHLAEKYNATYRRVAETMMKVGPTKFSELVLMGLFATNHRTIGDYLQFQFKHWNHPVPEVKHVAVVERDYQVCQKILEIEERLKNKPEELTLIQSLMKNLTWIPGYRGAPPNDVTSILKFQKEYVRKVNFIDADFMCNWGKEEELECVAKIINMFGAQNCVVHVNAISSYPRTVPWSTSQEEVKDILQKRILDQVEGKIRNISIDSYNTFSVNNVKTEMTSAVFAVGR